jgi:hypothetical protein
MVHTGAHTENITLVETICGDDCSLLAVVLALSSRENALVMRRLGWPAPSMMLSIRRGGGGTMSLRMRLSKLAGGCRWTQVDHTAWCLGVVGQ